MQFLNSNTGWAYGSSGAIIKTTNGGSNWTTQMYNANISMHCLNFLNQNKGVAIGSYNSDSILTFVTSNGGTNWNYVSNITNRLIDVALINSQKIIAVGNGGRIVYNNTFGYSAPEPPSLLSPYNNSTYVSIYHNIDWSNVQYADSYNLQISRSLTFDTLELNANTTTSNFQLGTCTLNRGKVYYWRVCAANFVGTGAWSQTWKFTTLNSFSGWTQQPGPDTLDNNSVFMLDSLTGWIAGDKGKILKTENGGDCWYLKNSMVSKDLTSIYSINFQTVWAVGDSGTILRTTNSGGNWENLSLLISDRFNAIYFTSNDTGWIAGNNGKLYNSINSGQNWSSISLDINTNINSIKFINSMTGWICGDSGMVYNTTNGGSNWVMSVTNTTSRLNSITFINDQTGWVVGKGGLILKTTNQGTNWSLQNSRVTSDLNCVFFSSIERGWVVGDSGYLIATKSAGSDWKVQNKYNLNKITSISFVNIENGWICGSKGSIYFTPKGSNITMISQNNQEIPLYFRLSQNYPNPFNPITKIEFAIPKTALVKLIVYDLLGREMSEIVNDVIKPGTYEATFNGSRLPSGVYFFRMITEGYSETKKMLLIK